MPSYFMHVTSMREYKLYSHLIVLGTDLS